MTQVLHRSTDGDGAAPVPPPRPVTSRDDAGPVDPGPQPPSKDRSNGLLMLIFLSMLALLASSFGVALTLGDGGDGGAAAPSGPPQTIDVSLADLSVTPANVTVPSGTDLTLAVHNAGALEHDLSPGSADDGTGLIAPGGDGVLELGVVTESLQLICTVPGHAAAGMTMQVDVEGAVGAATVGAATASTDTDVNATIDFAAAPAADWQPFDPTLAPAPGGTEHQITLHATEKVMEVSPGVTQQMWTFNDQVPGPVLRGKVGDVFTLTLVNDGELSHSIDLHASRVAWNDEMRSIAPGESLVYQFKAEHAGAFMYHCGTPPALHHIGNGMYGAIIIDPPELAPVDHEFVFVQSELYLGPEGEPGNLEKMQSNEWDAVVFNGYVNQYSAKPIRVEPDERVRVWVVDAGPSENSAFHIVGTVFDTVFKEGAYRLRPDANQGGAQVLDLQPAQGGFVEFSFAEAGLYPMVTHKFSNVGKGALGVFQAGEVATASEDEMAH